MTWVKEDHIKCEVGDYYIREAEGWYQVFVRVDWTPNLAVYLMIADNVKYYVPEHNYLGRFINEEQAQKFIAGMCNPRYIDSRFYKDYCHCGSATKGWEYVRTENLIYELCKTCKNPLRANIASQFRREAVADFDIFAFISGD